MDKDFVEEFQSLLAADLGRGLVIFFFALLAAIIELIVLVVVTDCL